MKTPQDSDDGLIKAAPVRLIDLWCANIYTYLCSAALMGVTIPPDEGIEWFCYGDVPRFILPIDEATAGTLKVKKEEYRKQEEKEREAFQWIFQRGSLIITIHSFA